MGAYTTYYHAVLFVVLKASWLNCKGSTGAGALVSKHLAVVDFGKAITSRIEVSPASNITSRSTP